ncbi:MAG TPA: cobalt-precorrin-5B (C(1))-methyltransferase [Chloroflexota bacterium]|nr:cobalt-precorrin-5B (C(1))-methyltransferase [Chloroflexota bacterium]
MIDDTSDGLPPAPRRRGLRTGYTTGACAAAAAKAAALALTTRQPVSSVTIRLPVGRDVTFEVHRCELTAEEALCSVIKDAGDDPDVTHGAEICARVRRADHFELAGGEGVGTVTRPGLGLEVGGPAINPVPRRMIGESVAEVTAEPLRVEISVPGGERMAKKTLNGRLGILGGISILGTTGIVRPYSTASWRASVEQAVDVAAANGVDEVVLSTGGRSEKFSQALFPELPELAFVEMGEFTGHALKRCALRGIGRATLVGMIGKLSKIAQGHFMTHVAGNKVDPDFLAELALEAGASAELAERIRHGNTARHVQEMVIPAGLSGFFGLICRRASEGSQALVHGKVAVETIMFDFDGNVLGRG